MTPPDNAPMLGHLALEKLLRDYDFQTVLDVGSGAGLQAAAFREAGKTVTTVDPDPAAGADLQTPFLGSSFLERFDAVWCCHVLEHQANVGRFLEGLAGMAAPGILAITVPPEKSRTVAGHLAHFNAGLLLYNMVCAGIDCSEAAVKTYGYNISVIVPEVRYIPTEIGPHLTLDHLADYFPVSVEPGGFDGEIPEVNW